MKRKKMSRLLSWLLSVSMLVSMQGIPALAENVGETADPAEETAAAEMQGKSHFIPK